jgi:hypothetical protein
MHFRASGSLRLFRRPSIQPIDVDPGRRKTLAIPLRQFHNCRKICTMGEVGQGTVVLNSGRCKPELARWAKRLESDLCIMIGNPATRFGDY